MSTSIQKELDLIESLRYGYELREPIHDALFKVNEAGDEKAEVKRGGAFTDMFRPALKGAKLNSTVIIAGIYEDE